MTAAPNAPASAGYVLQAGVAITAAFPELPAPLQAIVTPAAGTPQLTIDLPADYRPDRRYPLLCFIQGGPGGAGGSAHLARRILGKRGAIALNLPLFKRRVAALKADESNYWSRMFVRDADAKLIWDCYRVMLERAFTIVPNVDRARCALGGFSNGAHTTAVLLNRRRGEIRGYFSSFCFAEGGVALRADAAMAGAAGVMYEGTAGGRSWLGETAAEVSAAGHALERVAMPTVAHAFPRRYEQHLRRWLKDRWREA